MQDLLEQLNPGMLHHTGFILPDADVLFARNVAGDLLFEKWKGYGGNRFTG